MLEYKTVSMCVSSDYCRGWNDAVAEMPKWISVKERMPEKSMLVLGVVHGHVGELAYINDRNVFKRREHPIEGVTHWMPLPDIEGIDNDT